MSTAPTSPMARAVDSAIPYSNPHLMFGSVTRKNVWSLEAPSVHAACSSSMPSSSSTGTTSRTTNGMEMKIVTRIIEGSAKMIWIPRAAMKDSNHPLRPNSRTAISPTMTGETARGRLTRAETRRLPGNRSRANRSATTTPNAVVTATVTSMITKVR